MDELTQARRLLDQLAAVADRLTRSDIGQFASRRWPLLRRRRGRAGKRNQRHLWRKLLDKVE